MKSLSEILGLHIVLYLKIANSRFNFIQFTFCLGQFESHQFVEGLVYNLAFIALLHESVNLMKEAKAVQEGLQGKGEDFGKNLPCKITPL